MGAWIEIIHEAETIIANTVAPLVGAWIEIADSDRECKKIMSLPSWERGLKSLKYPLIAVT